MNCTDTRERLLDYHYGLLDAAARSEVDAHLQGCAHCGAALRETQSRLAGLGTWQPEAPAPGLAERTIEAARLSGPPASGSAPRSWYRPRVFLPFVWRWSAAACVLVGLLCLGARSYVNAGAPNPQETLVLGETELLSGAPAALRVLVRDHRSGAVLPGAKVAVTLRRVGETGAPTGETPTPLGSFVTDERGTAEVRFTIPDLPPGDYRLRIEAAGALGADVLERAIRLRRAYACLLTTDKPLYQPAQTIHLRVLALRLPQRRPVAGEAACFTVKDAKGNLVFKKTVSTSEFGIAATDLELADELNLGTWHVAVKVGATESERTVELKRYVLPRFKVTVAPERSWYAPGAALRGRVEARYLFGKPVDGGTVQVLLRPEGNQAPIAEATGNTGPDGAFAFELTVPAVLAGTELRGGDAGLLLTALVQDRAGHEERAASAVTVSRDELKALLVPTQAAPVPGVENEYFVFATYPDGTPAPVTVTLALLPGAVATSGRTDEAGVVRLHLVPPAGAVTARATLDDGKGHRTQVERPLAVAAADAAAATGGALLVRTDRAVYRVGETATVHCLVPDGRGAVYLDVVKERQTVVTHAADVKDGRATFALDLTEDLVGPLEVHAYRLLADGNFARETRLIQVNPAGALDVAVTLDRATYKPGEEARLRYRVTGKGGTPARAALGIAAVDEALFALAEEQPGLEKVYGSIEESLLQPLYQIKYRVPPGLLRGPDSPAAAATLAVAARGDTLSTDPRRATLLKDQRELIQRMRSRLANPALRDRFAPNDPVFKYAEASYSAEARRLEQNSYREKELTLARLRHRVDDVTGTGIGLCIGLLVFLGIGWLCWQSSTLLNVFVLLGGLAVVAALLLPALASARKGSVLMEVRNDARQVENLRELLGEGDAAGAAGGPRIRSDFPELLYWNPQIITDDRGEAEVTIPLADSITTWRLTQSAVSADGRLGSATGGIRVFQDFFVDLDLPAALTQGDEVSIPVALHNYLEAPQTVALRLEQADGFDLLDGAERKVELAPGQVAGVSFRARARTFGLQSLTVQARGSAGLADAVRRSVDVRPDGTERTTTASGRLRPAEDIDLTLPDDAIAGTEDVFLRVYPSPFSEVLHGMDAMIRLPYG